MISRDEDVINAYLDGFTIKDLCARFSNFQDEILHKIIRYRTQRVMKVTSNFDYNDDNINIINSFVYDSIIKINNIEDIGARKRMRNVIKLVEDGVKMATIANIFSISRERVRQLIDSYSPELQIANESRTFKKCEVCGKILKGVKKKGDFNAICKKCYNKISKDRKKRWSRDFDKCIDCGTTTSPHRGKGRCGKCHAQFLYHYDLKRRASLKISGKRWRLNNSDKMKTINVRSAAKVRDRALDGNRKLAIERDGKKCTKCGISEKESQKKYKRNLHVSHINSLTDNNLTNLLTLCSGCHNRMNKGRKN